MLVYSEYQSSVSCLTTHISTSLSFSSTISPFQSFTAVHLNSFKPSYHHIAMSSEFQSIALPKDYTKCLTQEEVALVTRVLNSQYTRAGIDPEAKDELLERLRFSMSTEEYIGDVSKYRKISPQGCLSILDKLISPRTSALTVAELSKLPKFCDFTGRLTTRKFICVHHIR